MSSAYMKLKSANPALNRNTFSGIHGFTDSQNKMTLQGTVNKTGLMLLFLVLTASWTWARFFENGLESVSAFIPIGLFGGFAIALILMFKKTWAPVLAPAYALLEGLFVGSLSALMESKFPGIVLQAVFLTLAILVSLLIAYKSRLIKPTENFKLGVVAATGGIMLVYLATFILGFFNVQIPYIHGSGPIGILFSIGVIVIASLNLVLDFDFIEHGADSGAPKYMEWFGAFGLMVTLIWLYIEILNLLAKLRSRN